MSERMNKTTRIIIGVAVAVIIWIVGIVIGQEQTITILNLEGGFRTLLSHNPSIQVSLMLDYGDGIIKVYPDVSLIYSQSVLELLEKVDKSEEKKLNFAYQLNKATGKLEQVKIGNFQSYAGGREWLCWLNNKLQTEDLNQIKLKAKDVVELKYVKLRQ